MNAGAERFWRGNERRLQGKLTLRERLLSFVLDMALCLADRLFALGGAAAPQRFQQGEA